MTREETMAYYEIPATREELLHQFDNVYRTTGFRPVGTVPVAGGGLFWQAMHSVEQLQDILVEMYDGIDDYKEDYKSRLHRQ